MQILQNLDLGIFGVVLGVTGQTNLQVKRHNDHLEPQDVMNIMTTTWQCQCGTSPYLLFNTFTDPVA